MTTSKIIRIMLDKHLPRDSRLHRLFYVPPRILHLKKTGFELAHKITLDFLSIALTTFRFFLCVRYLTNVFSHPIAEIESITEFTVITRSQTIVISCVTDVSSII